MEKPTATEVMREMLRYAQRYDLDSGVLIQACAEALAVTALTLDHSGDPRLACTLDERLASFNDHVRAVYRQRQRQGVLTLTAAGR